jgi:hypothetical protein
VATDKPLLHLIRDLAADDHAMASYRSDPDGYLHSHGYEVSPADVDEALELAADSVPLDEASRIMAFSASSDTAALDEPGNWGEGDGAIVPDTAFANGSHAGDFFGQGAVEVEETADLRVDDAAFAGDSTFEDEVDLGVAAAEPADAAVLELDVDELDLDDFDAQPDHVSVADHAGGDPDDFDAGSF